MHLYFAFFRFIGRLQLNIDFGTPGWLFSVNGSGSMDRILDCLESFANLALNPGRPK